MASSAAAVSAAPSAVQQQSASPSSHSPSVSATGSPERSRSRSRSPSPSRSAGPASASRSRSPSPTRPAKTTSTTTTSSSNGGAGAASGVSTAASGARKRVTIFQFSQTKGEVEGYSEVRVDITFTPQDVRSYGNEIEVCFKPAGHVEPVTIQLIAAGGDVPIFVERPIIDMRCILMNTTYRENVVIRNRGKVALRCDVRDFPTSCPPFFPLPCCFELFSPSCGFCMHVQAQNRGPAVVWCLGREAFARRRLEL